MRKDFKGEPITFVETQNVKEGVVCDVYSFDGRKEKDLGIIQVSRNTCTPLQKVLKGDKTIEGYLKGEGKLTVTHTGGEKKDYLFPGELKEVELHVGDTMQWCTSDSELTFYEVCYPPYENGRFENLSE